MKKGSCLQAGRQLPKSDPSEGKSVSYYSAQPGRDSRGGQGFSLAEAAAVSLVRLVSTLGSRVRAALLLRICVRVVDETMALPGVWGGPHRQASRLRPRGSAPDETPAALHVAEACRQTVPAGDLAPGAAALEEDLHRDVPQPGELDFGRSTEDDGEAHRSDRDHKAASLP